MEIDLEAKLLAATEEFSRRNGYAVTAPSERAQKLAALIEKSDDLGCKRDTVAEILSLVIGEPLPFSGKKDVVPVRWAVIVPRENPNGHNYPLGTPCVLGNTRNGAIKFDGKELRGTFLPSDRAAMRPATGEEIASAAKLLAAHFFEVVSL